MKSFSSDVLLKLLFVTMINLSLQLESHGQIRFRHKVSDSSIAEYNFLMRLGSDTVRLCGSRKGVISVSGGRIFFDMWQVTPPFVQCPDVIVNGDTIVGINQNTPYGSIEIVDGRATFSDPTQVLVVPFATWSIGVNSIPVRIRGREKVEETKIPSTVTSAFSLAVSLGRTWGLSQVTTRAITNWSITAGAFIGPSTAELKKETVKESATWGTNKTNLTITYGLNVVFSRNNFGILIAYGWDNCVGSKHSQWIYDEQPWFGFGVNAGFTNFMK